jgi:molybdopterin-guanine dinucleotide biosynthesis protein A
MKDQVNPAVVVLAGGGAQRMGGIDKCLLPWGQGTLLSHLLDQISLPVLLNAQPPHERFADYDIHVVADHSEGGLGPLAGIEAGLLWARDQGFDALITLAGDMPTFPADFFDRLLAAGNNQTDIVLAADHQGQVQPILGAWSVDVLASLSQALKDGVRKVSAFTDTQRVRVVPFEFEFININTQADYESFR